MLLSLFLRGLIFSVFVLLFSCSNVRTFVDDVPQKIFVLTDSVQLFADNQLDEIDTGKVVRLLKKGDTCTAKRQVIRSAIYARWERLYKVDNGWLRQVQTNDKFNFFTQYQFYEENVKSGLFETDYQSELGMWSRGKLFIEKNASLTILFEDKDLIGIKYIPANPYIESDFIYTIHRVSEQGTVKYYTTCSSCTELPSIVKQHLVYLRYGFERPILSKY